MYLYFIILFYLSIWQNGLGSSVVITKSFSRCIDVQLRLDKCVYPHRYLSSHPGLKRCLVVNAFFPIY